MKIRRILRVIALSFLGIILLTMSGAFTYEHISRVVAERTYRPEGRFIDVGGHKLHVVEQGNGAPTIIFESGMDPSGHLSWYKVQEELSRIATTISYDRAGILWSERGDHPKSSESITNDLTNLLANGGYPKPYILVGHSMAGITIRKFIETHKSDISGIVLVDASHPDQATLYPPKVPPRLMMNLMSSFGVIRLTSSRQMPNTEPGDRINLVGASLIHKGIGATFEEAAALTELSEDAKDVSSFGDIPLIVISANAFTRTANSSESELTRQRIKMQKDLLLLSTNRKQILASESSHYVQLEQPDIVINAITDLIARVEEK